MSEILELKPEVVKPYTFRKLATVDVFPMFKIISAIGINEFMACLESESLKNVVKTFTSKEDTDDMDSIMAMGAVAGFLEITNVILGNIGKCESDIYQLLSQTSNLSVAQIKKLDMVVFFEMIIDFIKKEEFKDFIKVVSTLFK
jgi:hypothetical protein